ncbi:hypothetical protein [Nesterenkonia halotolerans]|uniref:Uncharacterized protein n=1 Tax=Nesterenkonia halotolerans TaxID=225325 RepID=A0ABR9J5E1_9MICC|nr:hypothetical protein [Nesterenkonia halotolerans]MBE1514120.1 hypothetical protein [Nesterenkonia halotolerans]
MMISAAAALLIAGASMSLSLESGSIVVIICAWVGVALSLVLLACARVHVIADHEDLRVRSWFLGLPLLRARLEGILRVRVEQVASPGWGGGGGLRLTLRGRTLAVRGDQVLVLEMKDTGRDVRIQVRESESLADELKHQLLLRGSRRRRFCSGMSRNPHV